MSALKGSGGVAPRVVIVGAGPVGLFLAANLGWRGVPVLVVERNERPITQAKVMLISVRTMEFCRQLGFAGEVSDWGFPTAYPMNNLFVTSLNGHELARMAGTPSGKPGSPGFTPLSPEFQAHCPQPWFEPIVERAATSYEHVSIRRGHAFQSFEETADGVTVRILDQETGEVEEITADFLVGCDGFKGSVGRHLGIPIEERTVDYSVDLEFTTADLESEHDKGPAIRYTLVGAEGTWGTLVSVDGDQRWRLSVYGVPRDQVDTLDAHAAILRAVGKPFDYELIRVGGWKRRAGMAASFGRGRVYLAGDSAHSNPPNGGFGMNSGIADAVNLAWKLEAALAGWSGPDLLASYTVERRPVTQATVAEAVLNYHRIMDDSAYPGMEDDTAEAEAERARIGAHLVSEAEKSWRPLGIHLGYSYGTSSVVSDDPGVLTRFDPDRYEPSTEPGVRAPHVWLTDGRSVLDLFGRTHVLLRTGSARGAGRLLIESAESAGMPLGVHDLAGTDIEAVYGDRLVLVRPDGHIAWRGEADPENPQQVIDRIRGFAGGTVPASSSSLRAASMA